MKSLGLVLMGIVVVGAIGCTPDAYRTADTGTTVARISPQRAAHCRDLAANVPCRHADTGK
jgi:hypothetical protein